MTIQRLAILADRFLIASFCASAIIAAVTSIPGVIYGGTSAYLCSASLLAFEGTLSVWYFLNSRYIERNFYDYVKGDAGTPRDNA